MISFALIIPTRNRPNDIRTLLRNLSEQPVRPAQIVIIDASEQEQESLVSEFPGLAIEYHAFYAEPSAAAQRNAGLVHVSDKVELIGFVDDDIQFLPDAFERMLAFWQEAPDEVCGAAFNLDEQEARSGRAFLKHSVFARWLGLYSAEPGRVAPSGWHTRLGQVEQDTEVEWLISGAVFWRREVLSKHQFDPFFQGYSYLEDLDFSYGVSRECRLMVVANAKFKHFHHHAEWGKQRLIDFGMMEVRNRLFFVHKYKLSVARCYLGLIVRMMQTVFGAALALNPRELYRAKGNILGLYKAVLGN